MHTQKFKTIIDQYRTNRGGYSKFLNIYCEHCGEFLLLYQKDGPGPLKRLYMDRIIAPENLVDLQKVKLVNNLVCNHCKRTIAIPLIFDKENRKAYALLAYSIVKKIGNRSYPPKILNIN